MPASLRKLIRCRPGDAGQRARVLGELARDVEARLLRVGARSQRSIVSLGTVMPGTFSSM